MKLSSFFERMEILLDVDFLICNILSNFINKCIFFCGVLYLRVIVKVMVI